MSRQPTTWMRFNDLHGNDFVKGLQFEGTVFGQRWGEEQPFWSVTPWHWANDLMIGILDCQSNHQEPKNETSWEQESRVRIPMLISTRDKIMVFALHLGANLWYHLRATVNQISQSNQLDALHFEAHCVTMSPFMSKTTGTKLHIQPIGPEMLHQYLWCFIVTVNDV